MQHLLLLAIEKKKQHGKHCFQPLSDPWKQLTGEPLLPIPNSVPMSNWNWSKFQLNRTMTRVQTVLFEELATMSGWAEILTVSVSFWPLEQSTGLGLRFYCFQGSPRHEGLEAEDFVVFLRFWGFVSLNRYSDLTPKTTNSQVQSGWRSDQPFQVWRQLPQHNEYVQSA